MDKGEFTGGWGGVVYMGQNRDKQTLLGVWIIVVL